MESLLAESSLKELLSQAKSAQSKWDEWEAAGEYDRDEAWKQIYRDNRDGWNALYRAISNAVDQGPLKLKLAARTIEVGTVGVLSSTEMMSYSEKSGAEWVYSGVCLRNVESIELIER